MDFSALLVGAIVLVTIGQSGLILTIFLKKHQKNVPPTNRHAEKTLEASQKKGQGIVYRAFKRAQQIISEAELTGLKTAATTKFNTAKFEERFEKKLERMIKEHVDAALTGFDDRLLAAITQIEQNTLKSATDQAEVAKKEILDYKKSQMEKVDKEVVTILEELAVKVFGRKLSIKEHTDIIYETLDEVKKSNFIR